MKMGQLSDTLTVSMLLLHLDVIRLTSELETENCRLKKIKDKFESIKEEDKFVLQLSRGLVCSSQVATYNKKTISI